VWPLLNCGLILDNRILGSILQVLGCLVASVSGYIIYPALGGLILAASLIVFGLSVEKSGDV
jgi:hypothetical protein